MPVFGEKPQMTVEPMSLALGRSSRRRNDMAKQAKNTICLWYNRDAEEAARFYAKDFSRFIRWRGASRTGRFSIRQERGRVDGRVYRDGHSVSRPEWWARV